VTKVSKVAEKNTSNWQQRPLKGVEKPPQQQQQQQAAKPLYPSSMSASSLQPPPNLHMVWSN
jgi:hypothetical protein